MCFHSETKIKNTKLLELKVTLPMLRQLSRAKTVTMQQLSITNLATAQETLTPTLTLNLTIYYDAVKQSVL